MRVLALAILVSMFIITQTVSADTTVTVWENDYFKVFYMVNEYVKPYLTVIKTHDGKASIIFPPDSKPTIIKDDNGVTIKFRQYRGIFTIKVDNTPFIKVKISYNGGGASVIGSFFTTNKIETYLYNKSGMFRVYSNEYNFSDGVYYKLRKDPGALVAIIDGHTVGFAIDERNFNNVSYLILKYFKKYSTMVAVAPKYMNTTIEFVLALTNEEDMWLAKEMYDVFVSKTKTQKEEMPYKDELIIFSIASTILLIMAIESRIKK